MMNKTILMLSASCMSIIAGADWCCADFNHFDTSPSFIPAGVKSHVSTHTSHLTAGPDICLHSKILIRVIIKISNSQPPASLLTQPTVPAMNSAATMPMRMTAAYLPEAMTMTSTMPSAVARKDITKPPVPKVRNLPTSALTTALISKNASAIVPQTMSPAKTVSKAWAKPAAENMPPVATAAKVLIMSPFPTAMFRTAHFVPVVTVSNTKSNATPASILNAPPAAPAPVPTITALIIKNVTARPIMNGTMFPRPASAPRFTNTTASANTSPAATAKAVTINMPVANAKPAMSGMTHKANA